MSRDPFYFDSAVLFNGKCLTLQSIMKETRNENGYKSILRGTSIFGGVQIFQILVNLIRGKFVALFLGPDGMGAASMFNSASNTLTQLSRSGSTSRLPRKPLPPEKTLPALTACVTPQSCFCVLRLCSARSHARCSLRH